MSIVKLPLCYKCGVPHVPEEIASRVRSGEDITIEIISQKGLAGNVLTYGTGGINVDACRVGNESTIRRNHTNGIWASEQQENVHGSTQGRWPANLLLSHSLWCTPNGTKRVRGDGHKVTHPVVSRGSASLFGNGHAERTFTRFNDEDGLETVEDWHCAEDCPIRILSEQSGMRRTSPKLPHHHDGRNGMFGLPSGKAFYEAEGTAARYFTNLPPDVPFLYTSKASRAERNAGCEGLPEVEHGDYNNGKGFTGRTQVDGEWANTDNPRKPTTNSHPTVKPLALMRWLVRLVTPPDGIVLDCFAGSGSTCVAAIQEGVHFIAIEQDASYVQIAEARIAHARREVR